MENPKILVVDDEAEICAVTKSFLTKKNYSVMTAEDEPSAVQAVREWRPCLILLDLRLGSTSGIELLRKIKEIDKGLKVIMITGLGDEESIRQANSLGADGFVEKPFTADYLTKIIAEKLQ